MKLNKLLRESFEATDAELEDATALMSFSAWDSMAHMFFITKLEEDYEINLNGDEIVEMKTVGDVKKLILAKNKTP